MNAENLYKENKDFKDYVDKASHTRNRPKEEILKLKMAGLVGDYYKEKEDERSRNKT